MDRRRSSTRSSASLPNTAATAIVGATGESTATAADGGLLLLPHVPDMIRLDHELDPLLAWPARKALLAGVLLGEAIDVAIGVITIHSRAPADLGEVVGIARLEHQHAHAGIALEVRGPDPPDGPVYRDGV